VRRNQVSQASRAEKKAIPAIGRRTALRRIPRRVVGAFEFARLELEEPPWRIRLVSHSGKACAFSAVS